MDHQPDRRAMVTEAFQLSGSGANDPSASAGLKAHDLSMSAPAFLRAIEDGFARGFTSEPKARVVAALDKMTQPHTPVDIAAFQTHLFEWSTRAGLAKDFKDAGLKLVDGLNELTTKV
jgi:hypothetical protein